MPGVGVTAGETEIHAVRGHTNDYTTGSRDNTLCIDGTLRGYNAGAQQELVVICIYEELVQMEYAPPQELPISTTRVHVI